MRVIVVSGSPNRDGLTAACAEAAMNGCRAAGAEVEEIRLNDGKIAACSACDRGWGTCRSGHRCQVEDGFQEIHGRIRDADAYVYVSPVYFGEPSESMKCFTDRFRRCEAGLGDEGGMAKKPAIAVAAAGGGGGGTLSCLESLQRFIQHVHGRLFDLVPVTRWTRVGRLDLIRSTAEAMAREAAG